jgi:sugar lactone lactonase YvrE
MRRVSLVVGLFLLSSSPVAHAQPTSIPVGPRPESVVKGWGDKLYVSIQGASGDLGVMDGEVRQVDLATGKATPFATGMENPRGLTFTGKELVVADQKKIFRIDAAGKTTLLASAEQFPNPANFFNDIAAEPGGKAVYVTEMGRRDLIRNAPPSGSPTPPPPQRLIPVDSPAAYDIPPLARVYRITLAGKISSVFEPSRKLLVINGVTTSSKKRGSLLVLDFFHGSVVEVDSRNGGKSKTILSTGLRGADGVEQGKDGTIYVSSFENGMVWKMDPDGDNLKVLLNEVGFQTTADFALDEKAKKLYVPNTAAGTIVVVPTTE